MSTNIIALPQPQIEPQPFDFRGNTVRVVMVDGKPWFVASDVASILGYREAKDLTRTLDDKHKGRRPVPTPGGEQEMTVISEPGLYRAIGQRQTGRMVDDDRRVFIEAFQEWVYDEVIPTIRATGSYGQPAPVAELSGPELMAKALIEAQSLLAAKDEQLEAAQPAVEYHHRYVGNDDAVTVGAWGAQYGLTEPKAFELLRDLGIIRRVAMGDHWSQKKQRIVTDHEHRAVAGKTVAGKRCFDWFTLRPQHNVPRRHNGQVRQTLYIRQAHAIDLAKAAGLISKEISA